MTHVGSSWVSRSATTLASSLACRPVQNKSVAVPLVRYVEVHVSSACRHHTSMQHACKCYQIHSPLLCKAFYLPIYTDIAFVCRQVQEMHEQVAGQAAEMHKLYDWRDVMKTVHNEKLQELAASHHTDRDSLLQVTSQRCANALQHTYSSCEQYIHRKNCLFHTCVLCRYCLSACF